MRRELEILDEAISRLESDAQYLSFDVRAQLERGIYVTARALAKVYLHHDLAGFSLDSRRELDALDNDNSVEDSTFRTLERAFELKSVLSTLASGNPYLQLDLQDPGLTGKGAVRRMFLRRLKRYLAEVKALSENEPDESLAESVE